MRAWAAPRNEVVIITLDRTEREMTPDEAVGLALELITSARTCENAARSQRAAGPANQPTRGT